LARSRTARSRSRERKSKNRMNSRTERKAMLDMGRIRIFRYDLRHIVENSDMEEDFEKAFMANIVAKAMHRSIDDARNYISEICQRGDISDETRKSLFRLLKKHTRYR
jgi:hypothetical protein